MKITGKIVVGLYAAWVAVNIGICIFKIGDGGVSAHLALIFTGFPSSLFSLFIRPNGSIYAVGLAGVLGTIQWFLVTWLIVRLYLSDKKRTIKVNHSKYLREKDD